MINFANTPVWINILVFIGSAAAVWIAGTKIARYANVISERTGIGQALIGIVLLGGVTSLPELAVAITSAVTDAPDLAVNSILGGIAMQVAILAIADMLIGRDALTSVLPDPKVILQAGLKIVLLSIVTASIIVGDTPVLGVGIWMWLLLGVTGLSLYILAKVQQDVSWKPTDTSVSEESEQQRADKAAEKDEDKTLKWALWRATLAGAVIVVAGYLLSRTGDALAEQSGLGESFVGSVLVALSTSLPEVSTVISAVRAGLYTMAVSDIFGTNLFDVSFLFIIDLAGGGGAVMNDTGPYEGFASIIAITVTAIFVVGLAERRNRTVLRMGYDSLAVLGTYLCGLLVLFFLR
ncbi:sodium:calcium antiporter [Devosia salina]|uniref:Sodium:calcium antiporter n=1 Tax=Devosia salina TaxID=2860336 RepID=A0ABX8WEJ4_9HYPH|nr:sodium:calcium antiporter [Devosia salina]QYO76059.1 sodium:calcium antiporter [Devosia salina]